jgi:hypothetical protein
MSIDFGPNSQNNTFTLYPSSLINTPHIIPPISRFIGKVIFDGFTGFIKRLKAKWDKVA